MKFNQQNPSSPPLDIPLIPTGFCRDPRQSKRSVRPSQQLALVNFRPPSDVRSPTENHVMLGLSGHENMPDAFPEISPQSAERFNGLRLSERFAKVHQGALVRSPLIEIVAPKEDVSKLRFPLHPVQKIPNVPCQLQPSMVPREASVAPERSINRQGHLWTNGSSNGCSNGTTDPCNRRYVVGRADGVALGYVTDDVSDSETEHKEPTTTTHNWPALNGNTVVNGSTTCNSDFNGSVTGNSVVNGLTKGNSVVNGSTTCNSVVNGLTTVDVVIDSGAMDIHGCGTPLLSDSSSESEYSDSEEEDETPESVLEPCVADLEEKENKQERRWAMENFIPKRTSLVGLTETTDPANAIVVTGSDGSDCFDTLSLFDDLTVKPFLEELQDTKLESVSQLVSVPCDAVPQPMAVVVSSTAEDQSMSPPLPSTSNTTSRKRTKDINSSDIHRSKKSKVEEGKTNKSSSAGWVENVSLPNEGKEKSCSMSLSQPSTTTASKMSRKGSKDGSKRSSRDATMIDKSSSSSASQRENRSTLPATSGLLLPENGFVKLENGTARLENGSMLNENQTTRSENGSTQSENGSTRSENGSTRSENGSTQNENGTTRNKNGTTQNDNGIAQHENGTTQHVNGTVKHTNGTTWREGQSSTSPPSELSTTSKASSHKRSRDRKVEKHRSKQRKSENVKKGNGLTSSSSSLRKNGPSKINGGLEQPVSGSTLPQNHALLPQYCNDSMRTEKGSKRSENGSKSSDNGSKQTENRSKQSENGSKLTKNGSKLSENGSKQSENRSRQTEYRSKQSENGSKQSRNRTKQSENGSRQSENGSKQTENGSERNKNGSIRTENGSDTGFVSMEIGSIQIENRLTPPQTALTLPPSELTLPQNALMACQNGPSLVASANQPLDRRRESCEKNQTESLLSALNYNNERQRLETQSLTMNPESLSKFMMLTEALNSYVCYAFAYEQQVNRINSGKEFEKALTFSKKVCDQQTIQLIQHPWKNHVLVICHRLQSVIHFKCYRKNEVGKLKLLLEEQLTKMQPPKRMVGDTGNRNQGLFGDTMSPIMQQPTPSPAGSVTSVGSSGSGDRPPVMSPNFVISSRTHSILKSYMNYMTHLGESHDCWRRAVDIVKGDSDVRQFFASIDEDCGPISESSPILAISRYVSTALSRLRKRRDTMGRR